MLGAVQPGAAVGVSVSAEAATAGGGVAAASSGGVDTAVAGAACLTRAWATVAQRAKDAGAATTGAVAAWRTAATVAGAAVTAGACVCSFHSRGLASGGGGLLETGQPYPNAVWKIDGGTLFMKMPSASNTRAGDGWDLVFGPSKWLSMSFID